MTAEVSTGRLYLRLDAARCAGLGICESIAPDVFEIDADGDLVLLQTDVPADAREEIQHAVDSCPTQALRLE